MSKCSDSREILDCAQGEAANLAGFPGLDGVNSEGTTSTDYYRNQLKQRGRLLHIFEGTL